ncbi:MAG TPA: hypothetical protein VMF31_03395 [Solirubrobacterales bacterium]|nr:hypothetical protein [Solirubrobacterales bacterium]
MRSRFTTWGGSPVLLAAALVVAISLVGTAIAGRENSSSSLSRADVKKVVRKQIRALAPRLSVARAKRANNANSAQSAVVAQRAEKSESADHATRANMASESQNAAQVNGIKMTPVYYERNPGSATETILDAAGLALKAACAADGKISITATTSFDGASIFSSAVDTNSNNNNSNADEESGSFDIGDQFDLLAGSNGDPALITFEYDGAGPDSLVGVVTADQHHPAGDACRVRGQVSSGFLPPP